ncbi:hypothetical protein BJ138DRAFT_1019870 [Hygrophoropsis aurantiaca]|uniref:Uncharacterized protein n=1 Tax=Hygrophoropsis aurantiaca TaxID=72124 RepID=A0ACB7ZS64_9AGAM|nr:hypothetical protein BJ138DRAFT_1019870 [Hygrophoropsis aurantiaca]
MVLSRSCIQKKIADAFTNITSGNNPGCGSIGFKTAKGWDPVTGLGTPEFAQLADASRCLVEIALVNI